MAKPLGTKSEHETKFNSLMKKKRLKMNMSLKELGKRAGISKSYLGEIEKGKFEPSVEIGLAICQILEMNVDEFLAYIYGKKIRSVAMEIQRQCNEWGLEVPEFLKDSGKFYVERTVTLAYQAGYEQGFEDAKKEVKNKLDRVMEAI